MKQYDHNEIEKKWQKRWDEAGAFRTTDGGDKPKCYVLDMFPYPSGEGLHVGHPKGYIATDIYARFKRAQGFNVLHPMGWDAFGLPAEQYALKNKVHPRVAVEKNVARYKEQLRTIGLSYDWEREINTTDPAYYRWTQWIFLQIFKKGLAYESHEPINWCPSCKTGLANEDLDNGRCERCDSVVEQKPLRQWVLKIREYADRLLDGLDALPWPASVKELQRNWIGRSEGAEIDFKIKNTQVSIKVFTTRPDTLFGATYLVLAPEHSFVTTHYSLFTNHSDVSAYTESVKTKNEVERTAEGKEKTGVRLEGVVAENPATGEEIPVFVADYVLPQYGTGAIMAVPAHDERDWEFAKKYDLPIRQVICDRYPEPTCPVLEGAFTGMGHLVGSGKFTGMTSQEAKKAIGETFGEMRVQYRLRDWVFARQRYWGEPIPLIHCEKCGVVPVPENQLPVLLPDVESYEPTGTGESPLAGIEEWVNTSCPSCGGAGKRETNTMPQWAGSCWYYLRFMDPHNDTALVDCAKEKYWAPVDMYVGGVEHATRHLIYARFWHKFLYDIGAVSSDEPFMELRNQGLIMGPDGRKMSKRWGNVINPDDVVATYGADTLRLYEMFMGPFEDSTAWSTESIIGPRRFLEKVWRLAQRAAEGVVDTDATLRELHKTIKKVSDDIADFRFNTAVSAMMMLVNHLEKQDCFSREAYRTLLILLAPFAPHIAEELWEATGGKGTMRDTAWPAHDPEKIKETSVTIAIQINGKVRDTIEIDIDAPEDRVMEHVLGMETIKKWTEGKEIKKRIYISGKIVNIVVG